MQNHGAATRPPRDPTTGRYLTPGKLALLALISLYTENRIPSPSIIPVLTFVLQHLIANRGQLSTQNSPPPAAIGLEALQKLTVQEPSAITGRTIYDLLLKKLWELNSYDALHDFVVNLESYLADPKQAEKTYIRSDGDRSFFTRNSVIGAFIRRATLEFSRMPFAEAIQLWQGFIAYREPTLPQWKKRNLSLAHSTGQINTVDTYNDKFLAGLPIDHPLVRHLYGVVDDMKVQGEKAHGMVSVDDVEKLLEFQVDCMQRLGTRVPEGMQNQLKAILDSRASKPNLQYYVEFLNAWRSGDYQGSFECLHQYFDYTMHTRDRTFYQYALLNLAILQADFGCNRESILAMQETVNTARENKDVACLNFALSWLYHFHKAHPQDCPDVISARMERESLSFLKVKAKESGMHHLQSMAHLSEAKQALAGAESLGFAFESLLRSSHLNVSKGIQNAFGSQMVLQAAVWSRLGINYAAMLGCELFVAKYRKNSPVEDLVKAQCRTAFLIAQKGRFEEALERLENIDVESLRTLKYYQYWATYGGLIRLRRELFRGDFTAAEYNLQQLLSASSTEPDCLAEIQLCKIQLHMARHNFSEALDLLNTYAEDMERDKADIGPRLRVMLYKAQVLAKCGRAVKALSLTLRAAAIAWRAKILAVLYLANAVLANILIQMHEYAVAFALLDSIMPQILECEDAQLNGTCLSILADAQVGMAGREANDKKKRAEFLGRGLELLDKCFVEYGKLGDKGMQAEVMNKKARVHNILENKELRNEAAATCIQLKKGG
ncbi:anaphase promoting complex subunit 5 [Orbilia oligospora]|nr:anaphase promoting complex subunit 5 [Orbilia oligospora]